LSKVSDMQIVQDNIRNHNIRMKNIKDTHPADDDFEAKYKESLKVICDLSEAMDVYTFELQKNTKNLNEKLRVVVANYRDDLPW